MKATLFFHELLFLYLNCHAFLGNIAECFLCGLESTFVFSDTCCRPKLDSLVHSAISSINEEKDSCHFRRAFKTLIREAWLECELYSPIIATLPVIPYTTLQWEFVCDTISLNIVPWQASTWRENYIAFRQVFLGGNQSVCFVRMKSYMRLFCFMNVVWR